MGLAPPTSVEWSTAKLPDDRRANLGREISFDEIAKLILTEAHFCTAKVVPIEKAPTPEFKDARQAVFRISVNPPTYDLFYNAPDGLRGRYWQSPDNGYLSTRYLIELLKQKLLEFAKDDPEQLYLDHPKVTRMSIDDIEASLVGVSSKIWVRELDSMGKSMIETNDGQPQLVVRRWELHEGWPSPKGELWRWTPYKQEIDIKGALLNQRGLEYIPDDKMNRSWQIFHYGFT